MLRTLMTRRWLTWLLVATLWAILCAIAANWQWSRYQAKSSSQNLVNRNYNAPPVALDSIFQGENAPAASSKWKQVNAQGHYTGRTYLVRNRVNSHGDYGYEVVNVFDSGSLKVLVDRGWIANGTNAQDPSAIPAPPSGNVTLYGRVMPEEKSLHRHELTGQLASINVKDAESASGQNLADGYLRLNKEILPNGQTANRPMALDKPSQSMSAGINLSYTIQWIAGLILGYVFVFARARREHLDELALTTGQPRKTQPEAKKAKMWDWDEEDA